MDARHVHISPLSLTLFTKRRLNLPAHRFICIGALIVCRPPMPQGMGRTGGQSGRHLSWVSLVRTLNPHGSLNSALTNIPQAVPRAERYSYVVPCPRMLTPNRSIYQTHVARQIIENLGSIPTVIILSQVRSVQHESRVALLTLCPSIGQLLQKTYSGRA